MLHRRLPIALLPLLLIAGGCQRHDDRGPLDISVIGPPVDNAMLRAEDDKPSSTAAVLLGATGQGLVRYDAAGQIVPGLAARWIVTDTGQSLIFRLPDDTPAGTKPMDAEHVARRIRAAMAPDSQNPLRPLLGAIDEVDAVTPQVIDIELKAPRPNMLQLFAQPALAMGGGKIGPFTIVHLKNGVATLRPLPDPDADENDGMANPRPDVRVRGERAGLAIARFVNGQSRLVLGGGIDDLPIANVATLPKGALHFDRASGLFGLSVVGKPHGFLADPVRRRSLAMAIDRDRIGHALMIPNWAPATGIVSGATPEITSPNVPDWTGQPLPQRRAEAHAIVANWLGTAGNTPPSLRVAMPVGPGGRLLFALIAADWRTIGVNAVHVAPDAEADLRLIDEVAPEDVASFYLRAFACEQQVPCTPLSDQILIAARNTPSLEERRVLLAQADALIAQTMPFIPFGAPVRWSLVAPDLDLYRDSPRAIHPLNELKSPFKR